MTVVQENIVNTDNIREAAQRLADGNIQNSPDLEAIYWFPADHIIRLVMLDPVALPSEEMVPFFFGPFPQGGIPYPYAVILIRPEEKPLLSPPPDWGVWSDAVQLWPRK